MSKYSVTVRQLPGNEENKVKIPQIKNGSPNNKLQLKNKICTNSGATNNWDIITIYLSFSNVQKIIHRLLSHSRMILLPTPVPEFTVLELATKLQITPDQLSLIQKSPAFYKYMAKFINLPLVSLYCSCKLLPPNSSPLLYGHGKAVHHV